MSSPSKRHSHRHHGSSSGRKLRRLPKFSDNPPAQHEIVEKNDLLSALSGGGGKKQEDCDNVSSSDDTSPSKSNGHAAAGVDGEDKVGISLTCINVLASASD